MSQRHFMELLRARSAQGYTVCVGLDPDLAKIPECLKGGSSSYEVQRTIEIFLHRIVEATGEEVLAYKPNIAFFAGHGSLGLVALKTTIDFIKRLAPEVPVILDAKRGDIGNTNNGYVAEAFDVFGADAVTLNPYLGQGAYQPFLERPDKGLIFLCKTSNTDSGEFQDRMVQIEQSEFRGLESFLGHQLFEMALPFYQYVAYRVAKRWNIHGNCGLVVGATHPDQLRQVRQIVGDGFPILIPGIGAQGGEIEATVQAGQDSLGQGMIINVSRSVLYASGGEDFAEAARAEVRRLNASIAAARRTTNA